MTVAYTAEERAGLHAKARAMLEACPDVGSFIRRGLGRDPEAETLVYLALVQIASAGKRPVLYCRDFKLGARHSTLQAQVDLGHPDVPIRIVPCGCDASIRYRRS